MISNPAFGLIDSLVSDRMLSFSDKKDDICISLVLLSFLRSGCRRLALELAAPPSTINWSAAGEADVVNKEPASLALVS